MKYMIVTDGWAHNYVIPVAREEEWNRWWSQTAMIIPPSYAEAIGGSPTLVHFENYTIRN